MKKNDQIIGICEDYTYDGHGIVKVNGYPIFVKGLLLGEEAKIVVTKCKKTYGYGRYLQLLKVSEHRVDYKCEIAKYCGGCQIQHMSMQHQSLFKQKQVETTLRKIGNIQTVVKEIHTMQDPWNYRNKTQIPINQQKEGLQMGFYRIHSNTIIPMQKCEIQEETMNQVFQTMKHLLKKYPVGEYFRHLVIKHAKNTNQTLVGWVVKDVSFPYQQEMIHALLQAHPSIQTIVLNLNTRNDNVILGDQDILLHGDGRIQESIEDIYFHISLHSFYQVNPTQTIFLYQKVLEYAALTNTENVIDFYCGVGTISLFLAKKAKHVIGVEIVPQAIEDANENKQYNQIENVSFVCSDAGSFAKNFMNTQQQVDVVVVDPPRKGCDEITLESIVKMNPKRIVYVSCNIATLARDLKRLQESNYITKEIQPVDMFPHTYGIESVAWLESQ